MTPNLKEREYHFVIYKIICVFDEANVSEWFLA